MTRAVENPEVSSVLPRTGEALSGWDRESPPPDIAYLSVLQDLSDIQDDARAGSLARRLNSEVPGARSLIMGTYRALPLGTPVDAASARLALIEHDERWLELPYWQAIAKNSQRWTPDYLLASIDLKRDATGQVIAVEPEQAAFRSILIRTFEISLVVTVVALLMAYPLSFWLSTLSERQANLMLILVLLPFWTSVLVRIASWIVLLQSNGLVNRFLMWAGATDVPIPLLFNRVGVVIAMVHILLPFRILPLYSVMKTVPANYMRAAISLGSSPFHAFIKVYLPQTYPGIAAGSLLVFISSIGYYVTPALLGGPSDQMLSYYVAYYTNVEVNWGMAAALGSVLLIATLVLYALYRKVTRSELSLG